MISRENNPITILLVDDDADCRMLVRDAISESKVSNQVVEAESGEKAIQMLERQGGFAHAPRPGLIFLDIEMPGIDGLETLRRIRQRKEFQDIPVVMMTGVTGEDEMKLAAKYGANSYTIKPTVAEQFLKTVLACTNYWLTIHQYPVHHVCAANCRS
jgi:CheY-like chemotaxis protein